MIWLNGHGYHVNGNQYSEAPGSPHVTGRGFTGSVLVVDSGVMTQTYEIQLNLSQPEEELLKTAFSLCHTTPQFLSFVDARGMWYDTAAGADTATHKYSTGVTFDSMSKPEPTDLLFDKFGGKFYTPEKRFLVTIKLIVQSKVLN